MHSECNYCQIDGTFRVSAPPVLLGYLYEGMGHGSEDIPINRDVKTLLSLFISIQPPLTQPEPVKEKVLENQLFVCIYVTNVYARTV